jgi:RNA polymerase sigma factor (sigma-70 family)
LAVSTAYSTITIDHEAAIEASPAVALGDAPATVVMPTPERAGVQPCAGRAHARTEPIAEGRRMADGGPDTPDDNELTARAVCGDAAAFDQLVRRHGTYVTAYARAFTRGHADHHILAQDAWIKAFEALKRGKYRSGVFRAWMTTITKNLCKDWARRQRSVGTLDGVDVADPAGTVEDELVAVEDRTEHAAATAVLFAATERGLSRLAREHPRHCTVLLLVVAPDLIDPLRTVLVNACQAAGIDPAQALELAHSGELTGSNARDRIANLLDITTDNVKVILNRARKYLRADLAQELGEAGGLTDA